MYIKKEIPVIIYTSYSAVNLNKPNIYLLKKSRTHSTFVSILDRIHIGTVMLPPHRPEVLNQRYSLLHFNAANLLED